MRILVLYNLASGHRDSAIYDFMRALSRPGDEVTVRYVDQDSSFSAALADAQRFDCVVAAGGDGTHASACYLLRGTGLPILPYPSGTANLLTQNTISPIEPPALARLVRDGRMLPFDVGEVATDQGRFGFMMMAGCGYDATIMNAAKADKKRWGPADYFKAAFANPNPQVSRFTLTMDGRRVEHSGVGVLLVNFSKINFDISFTEENRPNDGLLDVLVLRTDTAWGLLPTLLGAAVDHSGAAIATSDALVLYRCREIEIVADPPLPVQYDGEPVDASTPMHARVLPGATNLLLSEEGYEVFCSK